MCGVLGVTVTCVVLAVVLLLPMTAAGQAPPAQPAQPGAATEPPKTPPTPPQAPPTPAPKAEAKPGEQPQPEEKPQPTPSSVEGLTPVTTESGLKYYDIKVGDGEQPYNKRATVTVHYTGWLTSGKVFDNSRERDEPSKFRLDQVVAGWTEGILSMRVGGKRQLHIPAALAYGERGRPGIPANSDLLFDVELLGVEQPPLPPKVEGIEPVVTPSGLKYYDLKAGEGEEPLHGAIVTLHYSLWLEDGTLLDSSAERGDALRFPVDELPVAGWKEGVQTMKPGGKRRLDVPPALGYGEEGIPQRVPPNATLIYEVELVKVEQPPKQASVEGIEPVVKESGLKYWDLKAGEGPAVDPHAMVTLHFSAWLSDGTLFHSSVQQGEPVTWRLGQLPLKGWNEAMEGMKVGGKRRMEVPPALAFGEQGRPPRVPPNATFILETELLEAKPVPKPTPVEGIEVVTFPSGLKQWDIKVGEGASPQPTDTVSVHYVGWLADGTVFDSSVERGEPVRFRLDRVIKGWTEGLGSMKVGGKRRLEIPPDLAYGAQERPGIPANSTLIFEVELLGINE